MKILLFVLCFVYGIIIILGILYFSCDFNRNENFFGDSVTKSNFFGDGTTTYGSILFSWQYDTSELQKDPTFWFNIWNPGSDIYNNPPDSSQKVTNYQPGYPTGPINQRQYQWIYTPQNAFANNYAFQIYAEVSGSTKTLNSDITPTPPQYFSVLDCQKTGCPTDLPYCYDSARGAPYSYNGTCVGNCVPLSGVQFSVAPTSSTTNNLLINYEWPSANNGIYGISAEFEIPGITAPPVIYNQLYQLQSDAVLYNNTNLVPGKIYTLSVIMKNTSPGPCDPSVVTNTSFVFCNNNNDCLANQITGDTCNYITNICNCGGVNGTICNTYNMEYCSSGKCVSCYDNWSQDNCTCSSSDTSKLMCVDTNTTLDTTTISSPTCNNGFLSCPSNTAIICTIGNGDTTKPMPSCMSWNPNEYIPESGSGSSAGMFMNTCPIWDETNNQWTCQDYFLWGNVRPPITFNSKLINTYPKGMANNTCDKTQSTFYPGTYGVINSSTKQYNASLGTLAYCSNRQTSGNNTACTTCTSCLGGTFGTTDQGTFITENTNSGSQYTTGYRVVSDDKNPYYVIQKEINGYEYCPSNGTTIGLASGVTNASSHTVSASSLQACQDACTNSTRTSGSNTLTNCYMYVYDDNAGTCNYYTMGSQSSADPRYLKNLNANFQSKI